MITSRRYEIFNANGKIALITGASQGIGLEIARALHQCGVIVWINHPGVGTSKADAESVCNALNLLRPDSAIAVEANVADAAAVEAMMADIASRSGGLDFLINNAGIIRDRTIAKMSLKEWKHVIDVNLTGVFHCCKYGLDKMRDGGAVVNMGSIAALQGFYGQANYSSAKGGVLAMTRVLSREVARRGIRVNAIAPGVVETAMAHTIPDNVRAEMLKSIPLGRLGNPEDIAAVALFLCSDLASYVTGQTIEVNGGWRG